MPSGIREEDLVRKELEKQEKNRLVGEDFNKAGEPCTEIQKADERREEAKKVDTEIKK